MAQEQDQFSSRTGASIYYRVWSPEQPKACIVVVHGLAEYSGRYERFAEVMNASDYTVCALDLPGHGRSAGRPGYIDQFSDYLDAVEDFLARIKRSQGDIPLFLLGHSLGGLIASSFILHHQKAFNGLILSGPAIQPTAPPPRIQVVTVRLLAKIAPQLGVMQLDANGVSRDPAEVKRYVEDPFIYHGKVSARSVAELFAAMQVIQNRAAEISLPLLILHGGADAMTAPAGSTFLHDKVSSTDKTLHIYPGLYHEIFNEAEREEIFAQVTDWLDAHLV
jgi:alpha-beta hydrolase superfamily lysophospholipase